MKPVFRQKKIGLGFFPLNFRVFFENRVTGKPLDPVPFEGDWNVEAFCFFFISATAWRFGVDLTVFPRI